MTREKERGGKRDAMTGEREREREREREGGGGGAGDEGEEVPNEHIVTNGDRSRIRKVDYLRHATCYLDIRLQFNFSYLYLYF